MRRVSRNNTEFTEIFSDFIGKIRNFTCQKVGRYLIDINRRFEDFDYIYADMVVCRKGSKHNTWLHIRIDYRYRNKRFRVIVPNKFQDEIPQKYIDIAEKAIEDKTGWRRIGPDE